MDHDPLTELEGLNAWHETRLFEEKVENIHNLATASLSDLIINTGTTEHVANQGNAFRVIHDLSAVGGLMYHEVPAGSWDHGLINYGPRFFQCLQQQNDYEQVLYRGRRENDMTIRSALRKRDNNDFVIPLDVPPELLPDRRKVRPFTERIINRLIKTARGTSG